MKMKNIPDCIPLTDEQLGVYLDSIREPCSLKYHIPFCCTLPKGTDRSRFLEATYKVLLRHCILFAEIGTDRGAPSLFLREPWTPAAEQLTAEDLETGTRGFCRPFDPETGRLFRLAMLHTPQGDAFLMDVHHIVFDGFSLSVLMSQIAAEYNGTLSSEENSSFIDVSLQKAQPKDPVRTQKFRTLFREKLSDLDCDSRPVPDQIKTDEPSVMEILSLDSGETLFSEAQIFLKENGLTENAFLTAAFGYTLAKFNGDSPAVFATAHHGRSLPEDTETIGMFVRTLPAVCRFSEDMAPAELISSMSDDYYRFKQNDCVPFSELSDEYGLSASVSFIYHRELFRPIQLGNGAMEICLLNPGDPVSDIEFTVTKEEKKYDFKIKYNRSLYTESFAQSFIQTVICVAKGMITAGKLSEIELVSAVNRSIIDRFNQTEKPYDNNKTVVELFRETARELPDALCLVYKERRFSYAEVDRITDNLAGRLLDFGIKKNSIVGVLIPRCEYMLLASLGILKAGAAYLPLDPAYPAERLKLMLSDSGAELLIAEASLCGILDNDTAIPVLKTCEIPGLPVYSGTLPLPIPEDLFVILYTSGSTGTPKGVMFAHSNTMVTAAWERDFYALGPGCSVTAYASYGFDANVFDTYATITSGAALHIIADDIRLDLLALQRYYNENRITHSTMTTQVGRQFALLEGTKTLRCLSVAGEKLTPLSPPDSFDLYNLYGPTEGSILVSGFRVDSLYKDVPIGKAIDNVKLYVTDPCGRLLPPGAAGELWITGPHVTKGYRNNPEKTAAAYCSNPFCQKAGYERSYRTGDIVRLMGDGNIQFIGRRDGQIKVRGFRIELKEVEEIIHRFEGIKDATVAAFDDPSGGKYLAAYVVSDKEISIEALNAFIRSEKPAYMVPAVTMQIDSIPLNQNHKVDKKRLPRPERKAENAALPENGRQRQIFDLAAEVIGNSGFGIDTDLFDAGLTSIGVLRLNVELSRAFDAVIRLTDFKEHNTVRKLAEFLIGKTQPKEHDVLPDYPITQTQKGVFVECSMNCDSTAYNIPMLLKADDSLDPEKLKRSVCTAINAHPYLKTTLFADADGEIRAKRRDADDAEVLLIRSQSLPSTEKLVRPFSLLNSPLYRAAVYETPEGLYLFLDFHHIVFDGTSAAVLLADVEQAYGGAEPEKEAYSGFEVALSEEKDRASEKLTEAKAYYDSVFLGCETECLPQKTASNNNPLSACETRTDRFRAEVREWCEKNKLTPNALFVSAFGFALSRFTALNDVVFTTVYHGRSDSRLLRTTAMLVKTLPVLVRAGERESTVSLASRTQEQLLGSMTNDVYSFAEVAKEYNIRSDIIFAYQGDLFRFDTLCGKPAQLLPISADAPKAPITVTVEEDGDLLSYRAEYRGDLYSAAFMESFLDAFATAVRSFCEKDSTAKISLLSEQAEKVIAANNLTEAPYENIPVHRLFERLSQRHPDRIAAADSSRELTYARLNALANRTAHALIRQGLKTGGVVGIMLERTVDIYVVQLGILKAGGAFLGILPNYPDERVDFCLRDSQSVFVITTDDILESKASLFAEDKKYRALTLRTLLTEERTDNPDLNISTDNLAYCIYTSGTTGNPKGVMIGHHNLAAFVQQESSAAFHYYGSGGGSVSLAMSSFSFDMSLFEGLVFLLNGKTVVIASEREIHDPAALSKLAKDRNVDCFTATPSLYMNYLDIPVFREVLANAKSIMAGAEAFPAALYNSLRTIAPQAVIMNGYGPSECTICSSIKLLNGEEEITIGRPISNTAYYVTDPFGNLLPPYACGELIICGAIVGHGYIGLPEKNSASFFRLNGLPAYHSGDLARIVENGEAQCIGRMDDQIKLRGFRIELGEIERCICAFKGIKQSKVIVRNNGSEDYLAGFFTAEKKIDVAALTAHMKETLTYYMVPDVLMQLDAMPLTINGKLDKKALPETRGENRKSRSGRKPKRSLEAELCELFGNVLSVEDYCADDNFFEMGGTSLSAAKVIMQLMAKDIKVEYQDIFDNPTPEALAAHIESQRPVPEASVEAETPRGRFRPQLECNTLSHAGEVRREPLGDVLLTGAVGFLGIHVLRELIELNEGKIICLIRKDKVFTPEKRLRHILMYYFGSTFEEALKDHVSVIDADITDDNLPSVLSSVHFDTLINCAAIVKHYASDEMIEHVNVHGVENLIRCAKEKGAGMIQISTTSIPGVHTEETYRQRLKMYENELFTVDTMNNKYLLSKYHAELRMMEAIRDGLKGKIIRVGNLMGRYSDGEFQINSDSNAFLHALRGFVTIGKCPISHVTDPIRLSPIDLTARAILLLAGTNPQFTAYNVDNRFGFDEMQLILACNDCGIPIKLADDADYYADYYRMLGDERVNAKLSGLVTNDRPDVHMVETDNTFTANILYRLGFSWPFVDNDYLKRIIDSLITLDYFGMNDEG